MKIDAESGGQWERLVLCLGMYGAMCWPRTTGVLLAAAKRIRRGWNVHAKRREDDDGGDA